MVAVGDDNDTVYSKSISLHVSFMEFYFFEEKKIPFVYTPYKSVYGK